jgi:hypothetical protein
VFHFIGILASIAIAGFGYWQARKFVQNKLQYVDAVHTPMAPLIAGIGAAVIISPITLLPILGFHLGTAALFGAAVAVGVVNGARNVRKRIGA